MALQILNELITGNRSDGRKLAPSLMGCPGEDEAILSTLNLLCGVESRCHGFKEVKGAQSSSEWVVVCSAWRVKQGNNILGHRVKESCMNTGRPEHMKCG